MNFLDLYKTIKRLDEGDMNQGTAMMAPPSTPELDECGGMGECGGIMPIPGHQEAPKQQDSVSMSVNMNGQGAGGIRDLMDILRNIESNIEKPDHDDDDVIIGEPDPEEEMDIEPIAFEEPNVMPELDQSLNDEEYDNEPDPQEYDDTNILSGDDLNKEKDGYPMAQKGDNAMAAIKKTALVAASINESLVKKLHNHYNEVKSRSTVSEGYYGWDDPHADDPEDDYGYSNGTTEMELVAPYDIDVNDIDYNVKAGEEVIFMVDYDANGEHFEVERVYYGGFDNIPEIEIDWNKTPRNWNNMVNDKVGEWLLRQSKQKPYGSQRRQQEPVDRDYDDPATSFNAMTDYEKRINRDF